LFVFVYAHLKQFHVGVEVNKNMKINYSILPVQSNNYFHSFCVA
jgi:hypothetical protein